MDISFGGVVFSLLTPSSSGLSTNAVFNMSSDSSHSGFKLEVGSLGGLLAFNSVGSSRPNLDNTPTGVGVGEVQTGVGSSNKGGDMSAFGCGVGDVSDLDTVLLDGDG